MARFTGIPELPPSDITFAVEAIKQNVELLTGGRGEPDRASQAVVKGDLDLAPVPEPDITALSAKGAGFEIQGQKLVSLDDYSKLLTDVQRLIVDVAQLNRYVNILVEQLKR
jgi:hypothetical protein